jgi:uncharacterized membrane protein YtjA (UPF0391 family)
MLRASLVFFVVGLMAIALGANGVGGVSLELGRLLLFVFLGLSILSFLGALVSGRTPKAPSLFVAGLMTAFLGMNALPHLIPAVHAGETVKEKAENAGDDAQTHAKKSVRKGKRSVRKATGQDSAVKDAKDGVQDAGDSVANSARKVKRKADTD